ncbi:hypothetical protein BDN67DRAFT_917194 [Paxillus ammoniavirescens]|nr:hypothetical protein BDN67DRAFT_917194 [Paxillus ammoniavirescens]
MPHEMVYGQKPDLSNLHHLGCTVFVKISNAGKLDEQAKAGKFVGYDMNCKGYRIYWPDNH